MSNMCIHIEVISICVMLLITLNVISTASIGEKCYLNNGSAGICKHISSCTSAKQDLKKGQNPVICGFDKLDTFPIVCCQENDNTDSNLAKIRLTDTVDQKCDAFYRPVSKRQVPTGFGAAFAIGGVDALPQEYPHMAILGYGTDQNIEWGCGGSLIGEEYVLTAAHCLFSRQYGDVTDVRLGDLDIGSTTDNASPQNFKVAQRIPHPDYSTVSHYHDIALLKLDRPAIFTQHVRPACLQTGHVLETNNLTATGWGATYYGGGIHSFLQKVQLNYLPLDTCKATYKPDTKLVRGLDEQVQICAGNTQKGMDTCQGDSGGPLQRLESNFPLVYRIVGITSFGKDCGLVPAVYTRVSTYIQWISSIVWP